MRNEENSKIQRILRMVATLPLFTLDDLASVETNKTYLKILLSRHQRSGSVVRLKKGTYVTKDYVHLLEKSGRIASYVEFLASALYSPSYVSGEYVLYQHGIITEFPVMITAVSTNKTATLNNQFGRFRYQSITATLFTGFEIKRDGDLQIFKASPAKALFDYLYFRKRHLNNPEAIEELRLNVEELSPAVRRECLAHAAREGTDRMKTILKTLFDTKRYE